MVEENNFFDATGIKDVEMGQLRDAQLESRQQQQIGATDPKGIVIQQENTNDIIKASQDIPNLVDEPININ